MGRHPSRYRFSLPGEESAAAAPRRAGRRRCKNGAEDESPPHLAGLPQLSDFLSYLAGRRDVNPVEQMCIARQVRRICRLIREARIQWEAEKAEKEPCRSERLEKQAG